MRFRNYINRKSGLGRIYSDEDLLKMMLGDLLDNEETIMAQNERIGIPTLAELEESPNTEWIAPYTNWEGNPAGGYWQSVFNPYAEQYDESFVPENKMVKPMDIAPQNKIGMINGIAGDSEPLHEEDENMQPPLLQGSVEYKQTLGDKIKNDIGNKITEIQDKVKNTTDKYEGLDPVTAAQKAGSKFPLGPIELQYYGLQSHLNDGEKIPQQVLDENNIFKYGDIEDRKQAQKYTKDLAKMYGYDPNDKNIEELLKDKVIVEPKENSRISKYIKNSDAMQQWVADNYERLKNGDIREGESVEFSLGDLKKNILDKEKRGLYLTLHKAGIDNIQFNEDGSMSYELKDPDNYELWGKTKNWLKNQYVDINNRAYKQQEAGQLENFLFNIPQNLTKEEIEKILKRKKKRNY